jgi:hypothetical protein
MLKAGIGLVLGLVLGILAAWWRGDPPPCEVLARGEPVAAPNGNALANWRQEACGDGWFVTVVFTVVEVTSGQAATRRDVVRVSESDLARGPMVLSWLGPQHLSVHVPAALGVTLRPFEVPGLKLTVSTEAGRPDQ